uniref:Uncharacterized protein n=1 Tax=Anguilla anguilla TaxID=7936 RepID=A0A0E9TAT7_ANGAN
MHNSFCQRTCFAYFFTPFISSSSSA